MTAGIFHFRNTITGDGYVGESSNIENRVSQIVDLLKQGRWIARSKSPQAVVDWEEYGEDAFKVLILEARESEWNPEWESKRRYWQAKVNSVYNVNLEAEPVRLDGSGVYMITNLCTGDRYIGSTDNFHDRRMAHISSIRNGRSTEKIQNSFTGLDINDFRFEVLERCSVSQLADRENFWIEKMKPGLNTAKVAVKNYCRNFK